MGCNCNKHKENISVQSNGRSVVTEEVVEIVGSKNVGSKQALSISCFADCSCGEAVVRVPYEFLVDMVKNYPDNNIYKERMVEVMQRASARSQSFRQLLEKAELM